MNTSLTDARRSSLPADRDVVGVGTHVARRSRRHSRAGDSRGPPTSRPTSTSRGSPANGTPARAGTTCNERTAGSRAR